MSDHIQRSKKRLNRILAENTGKTPEEIAAATDRDNYMSADEALEFGLSGERGVCMTQPLRGRPWIPVS